MQAPKNGFFYVLDRASGELSSAQPYVEVNWASGIDRASGRPVETAGARYEDAAFVAYPAAHAEWDAVVLGGARPPEGMPGFASVLNKQQSDAVHAYVIKRAHDPEYRFVVEGGEE